jgi:hypothetical protein
LSDISQSSSHPSSSQRCILMRRHQNPTETAKTTQLSQTTNRFSSSVQSLRVLSSKPCDRHASHVLAIMRSKGHGHASCLIRSKSNGETDDSQRAAFAMSFDFYERQRVTTSKQLSSSMVAGLGRELLAYDQFITASAISSLRASCLCSGQSAWDRGMSEINAEVLSRRSVREGVDQSRNS